MRLEDKIKDAVDVMSVKCDEGKLYGVIIDTHFNTSKVEFYFQRYGSRKKEKLDYSIKFHRDGIFKAKMYLRGNLYNYTMNYCKKIKKNR